MEVGSIMYRSVKIICKNIDVMYESRERVCASLD